MSTPTQGGLGPNAPAPGDDAQVCALGEVLGRMVRFRLATVLLLMGLVGVWLAIRRLSPEAAMLFGGLAFLSLVYCVRMSVCLGWVGREPTTSGNVLLYAVAFVTVSSTVAMVAGPASILVWLAKPYVAGLPLVPSMAAAMTLVLPAVWCWARLMRKAAQWQIRWLLARLLEVSCERDANQGATDR
jgi:hypothetical protein